jgi:hypothetical protein
MKHLSLRSILALFASVILVLTACQKNSDLDNLETTTSKDFVTEAKAWFANGPVSKENRLLSQPTSVLPLNAPQRIFARMGKIQKKLIWENAQHYNTEGLEYLVVPVDKNLKKYGNDYELAQSIVFYENNGSEMRMNVVEVLSKKGTSLQDKATEIVATAFRNSIKHKNEQVLGINATVFFYNDEYKAIGNYEFSNGNFIPYPGKLQNKRMDGESQTVNSSLIESELCQVWNVYLNTYDEWGVLISQVFLFSYEVGNCGGDPNEEQLPEGEGGGEQDLWEEDDVAKFADFEWTAFNIPTSFGGGNVSSLDRFMGRVNQNKPERNKFIGGGGHLGTYIIFNAFDGRPFVSIYGVVVNSASQATAKCGGSVGFDNGTPNVNFNSTKIVSFSQLSWQ